MVKGITRQVILVKSPDPKLFEEAIFIVKEEALSREGDGRERALCSNACVVARALEKGGRPVYQSGQAVLEDLTVEGITALARRWAAFDREENPSLTEGEERVDALKKVWSTRRRSAFGGVCSGLLGRFPPRREPGG